MLWWKPGAWLSTPGADPTRHAQTRSTLSEHIIECIPSLVAPAAAQPLETTVCESDAEVTLLDRYPDPWSPGGKFIESGLHPVDDD